MRAVTFFCAFTFIAFLYPNAHADICTTTRAFTWSNSSAGSDWSCGRRPQGGDVIIIRYAVTISSALAITGGVVRIEIESGGSINFPGASDRLELPSNSGIIIEAGGQINGINSSNQIRIGNDLEWKCGTGGGGGPNVETECPFVGPNSLGNPNALPIRLLSFDARVEQSVVKMEWITASEENNHYFTIQRSIDGSKFDSIGTVAGAGNSFAVLNYSFTDASPLTGNTYYRLKQTDYDRTVSYSKIVSVSYQGSPSIKIYPNPSESGIFEIYFTDGSYQVYVLNSVGSLVKQETFSVQADHTNKLLMDLSTFPRGIYIVYVYSANQPYTFRLVY